MTTREVRNWIGLYVLLISGCLGGYMLLFGETFLLPMSKQEATDVFQIIIPVLIGQLAVIFRWYAAHADQDLQDITGHMPPWVIKGPPLIVIGLLVVALLAMVVGNIAGSAETISPSQFKAVVTFCVSILNATTIIVISGYFKTASTDAAPKPTRTPDSTSVERK
jgi:hypothetical protein